MRAAWQKLLEMKSTDRKQALLHYLVKVIAEKYPQLTGFHSDLHFLDKAGSAEGTWLVAGEAAFALRRWPS
ncbi:MAP3K14-AS1 isoform 9 [Pongo abelii]|uniref:MAP3K14-AS1 isoform 9 n=1 Tax=Pongo abelii TaxID=9601 RepID=A0A2J8UYW1_PONAB|nr:MAP3K14-AS1 isoform 9 [Pongo abelii]